MKVLTISNCPLIAHQGSGYVITGFIAGLRERGWTVDAFGPEHFDPWPTTHRARTWRIAFGMLIQSIRCMRRKRYDVVEFYGGESWLAISVLSRLPGRKFLIVSHSNGLEPLARDQLLEHLGSDTHDGSKRRWYQISSPRLMASGFRSADALVLVSDAERRYALDHRYQPAHRVVAIDNPLPRDFLGQDIEGHRGPVVVYCGSWIPRKGIRLITTDLARVLRERKEVRLRLIGVGNDFKAADHFPQDVCGQIEVLPFVTDKQALRVAYRDCAIAIMPSYYESFGLVAAEAMASGCALVASCTGYAAGLHDGKEALLLPAITTPHLYELVSRLLTDQALGRSIAHAGYERVQRLQWHAATATLAETLEQWIAERRSD